MEFEEEGNDDPEKDVTLSDEQERRDNILHMGYLKKSQDGMEGVHHGFQDIQPSVMSHTREEKSKVLK